MNKFEKKIRNELDSTVPDLKDSIKERVDFKENKKIKAKYIATPILALMVLLIVVITPIMVLDVNKGNTNTTTVVNKYTLSMTVNKTAAVAQAGENLENTNPSIQIIYKNNKVIDIVALNKSGLVILQSSFNKLQPNVSIREALMSQDLKVATKRIIEEIKGRGYLVDSELDIIIKDENGLVNHDEINIVGRSIKDVFNDIKLGKMDEDDLDDLEDILEANPDIYNQYFLEDIKQYLDGKKIALENLIDGLLNEAKKEIPTLDDIYKAKDEIEDYFEDLIEYDNPVVVDLVKEYQLVYSHDISDDIDLNNLSGKDFSEIYDSVIDEYKDVIKVYNEISKNELPDDIDDMLEDIYYKK